jgi:hypothetical protein
VSRSGYYDWVSWLMSATAARREELESIVAAVFEDSDGTYGYRRIHAEMVRGQQRLPPRVGPGDNARPGPVSCQPRPFRPTTTVPGDAAAGWNALAIRRSRQDRCPTAAGGHGPRMAAVRVVITCCPCSDEAPGCPTDPDGPPRTDRIQEASANVYQLRPTAVSMKPKPAQA